MKQQEPLSIIAKMDHSDSLHAQVAQARIRTEVTPLRENLGQESVNIHDALGRILALDIISPINVPPADNSAMDGYAFNSAVLSASHEIELRVAGSVLAGQSALAIRGLEFNPKSDCFKIMTGAVIPAECDTVIPHEWVQLTELGIRFSGTSIRAGHNCRRKGEDLGMGLPALRAGRRLMPSDLGLIASLGISQVPVKKRLKVAFFSTGNEICSVDETLRSGSVFDSNRYTIFGMLSRLGLEIIDLGIVRDDPSELSEAFEKAAKLADVIITSGGVSAGDADFTRKAMAQSGDIAFWNLAIKPGRPMAFGQVKNAILFGLPGNPVAVMTTFYLFVQDALLWISGAKDTSPPLLQARLSQDIKKRAGRTEFIRASLSCDENGITWVCPNSHQGSGVLRSMSEADCFIILKHEEGNITQGSLVNILLFTGLI